MLRLGWLVLLGGAQAAPEDGADGGSDHASWQGTYREFERAHVCSQDPINTDAVALLAAAGQFSAQWCHR